MAPGARAKGVWLCGPVALRGRLYKKVCQRSNALVSAPKKCTQKKFKVLIKAPPPSLSSLLAAPDTRSAGIAKRSPRLASRPARHPAAPSRPSRAPSPPRARSRRRERKNTKDEERDAARDDRLARRARAPNPRGATRISRDLAPRARLRAARPRGRLRARGRVVSLRGDEARGHSALPSPVPERRGRRHADAQSERAARHRGRARVDRDGAVLQRRGHVRADAERARDARMAPARDVRAGPVRGRVDASRRSRHRSWPSPRVSVGVVHQRRRRVRQHRPREGHAPGALAALPVELNGRRAGVIRRAEDGVREHRARPHDGVRLRRALGDVYHRRQAGGSVHRPRAERRPRGAGEGG
eukprot:31038-Pelagococcus_subviridis.AAC.4